MFCLLQLLQLRFDIGRRQEHAWLQLLLCAVFRQARYVDNRICKSRLSAYARQQRLHHRRHGLHLQLRFRIPLVLLCGQVACRLFLLLFRLGKGLSKQALAFIQLLLRLCLALLLRLVDCRLSSGRCGLGL